MPPVARNSVTSAHQFGAILVGLVRERMPALKDDAPLIVAIDGRSGAGKTTLTSTMRTLLIREGFCTDIFRLDDTYQGWTGLSTAIKQWQVHSANLARGRAIHWNGWDWITNTPTGPFIFPANAQQRASVLLVEGVGALAGTAHIRCWIEQETARRKHDALERDGETYRPFWDTWAAQEDQVFTENSAHYQKCDILYER